MRPEAAAARWAQLPGDALAAILARVPPGSQRACCTLVCSSWSTAAAAQLTLRAEFTPQRLAALHAALRGRLAACVEALELDNTAAFVGARAPLELPLELPAEPPAELPGPCPAGGRLPRLCRVVLRGFELRGGGLGQLARVTRLELACCSLDAALLAPLVGLRSLRLSFVGCDDDALGAALPALTGLSSLALEGVALADGALAGALCRLGGLAELACRSLGPASMAVLPASLTSLTVVHGSVSSSASARMAQLPGLREVVLNNVHLHPNVLSGVTGLTRLRVQECRLAPPNGEAALLRAIGAQSQLAVLELVGALAGGAPAQAYAALTSCSRSLRTLDLSSCALPADAARHVFPPSTRHAHLLELDLYTHAAAGQDGRAAAAAAWLPAAEARRVLAGCPQLQALQLFYSGSWPGTEAGRLPPLELAALSSLTLHSLDLASSAGGAALASLAALSALPALRMLRLVGCALDLAALLAVAQLSRLRELDLLRCRFGGPREDVHLISQAPPGAPPDVAQQLLGECLARVQRMPAPGCGCGCSCGRGCSCKAQQGTTNDPLNLTNEPPF